jgi:hypothetical protein
VNLPTIRFCCTLFTIVVALSGCASILSTSNYQLHVRTEPKDATISISDKKGKEIFRGQSPANVNLKSGAGFFARAEYQVRISSPGYAEKVVPVNFRLNAWYWGNILIGGVIGMLIVDPATGAMWRITDPMIDETLTRSAALASTGPSLNVVDINNVSKETKDRLTRIN